MQDKIIRILRWLARFISALVLIIVFMLALGGEIPSFGNMPASDLFMFIGLIIMIAGHITVWFKEFTGAVIILAGFLIFWILYGFSINWYIVLLPISGILYLYCAMNDRNSPGRKQA